MGALVLTAAAFFGLAAAMTLLVVGGVFMMRPGKGGKVKRRP
jgi:hypothetical protein